MNTLFSVEPVLPTGFIYIEDFISKEEEQKLLEIISGIPLKNMIFQNFEAKRKVAGFGLDYSFDTRKLSIGKPLPRDLLFLIHKVASYLGLTAESLSKVLLTEYPPGSVINWHRDAPPYELIAGISLLSDCIFKLRPHNKSKQSRAATLSFPVKRRSLYIMKDEVRENWQHSISPVKETRYSITLRTLRNNFPPVL